MKHKLKKLLAKRPLRRKEPEKSLEEAISNIPRITNETVAEHREEVLSSARKYIYPLQHSLHRIVLISTGIFIILALTFFTYCTLALYRFNSTSTFIYRVTQVIPFPVAKAGSMYVSYEDYLFELRHYMHYYQTQQKVDFDSDSGRQQLAAFRKVALQTVVNNAYIKQLAARHHVSVTNQQITSEIELLRSQNRLGSNNAVFEDVLKEFWGWSIEDFKRELKSQMVAQKVVSELDTGTHSRAEAVLAQLRSGGDFATIAKQSSEDLTTKGSGGDYGFAIDKTNRDLSPQVVDQLFKLQLGQVSDIVETPLGLEILKVNEHNGDIVRASHIYFAFKPIATYTDPLKAQHKPHNFIK
ncbi:MAG TPA: peptidylprolyl isomerase [Bacillota bacterium]|nr:peptidylprolyl isomerase [Bacillota bacterium]HSX36542.1 peptidylprolyl isomerase [Patescibacteria group bacterium]